MAEAVARYLDSEENAAVDEVAAAISSSKLTLLGFIEALGPGLDGGSSEATRVRAMKLLQNVLAVDTTQHSEKEVGFLVQFFGARLQDYVTALHAVAGIETLVRRQRNFGSHVTTAVQLMFDNLHVQSSTQQVRQSSFRLMLILTESYPDVLKIHFGSKYTLGVVKQVDGEKDPRCLLSAFSLVNEVVRAGFDIDEHVEDLFDITSCYFPITFSPPPNDKFGITREDLVDGLNACLTSTSKFSKMWLEQLFDQLAGNEDLAKIQSYGAISVCATAYGLDSLMPYLNHIYLSVRTELLQCFDETIKNAALNCLTNITGVVAKSVSSSQENPLVMFLEPIIAESTRSLSDFDSGLVTLHSRILAAAAKASHAAASHILKTFGSAMLEKANNDITDRHRLAFVCSLSDLIGASIFASASSDESPVDMIKGGLTHFILDSLKRSDDIRASAFECLAQMLSTGIYNDGEISDFLSETKTVLLSNDTLKARSNAQLVTQKVLKHYRHVGVSKIIPELTDVITKGFGGANAGLVEKFIVQSLAKLAVDHETSEMIIGSYFDRLQNGNVAQTDVVNQSQPESFEYTAKALQDIVDRGLLRNDTLMDIVIIPALKLFLKESSSDLLKETSPLVQKAVLEPVKTALRVSCQSMEEADHDRLLVLVREIFVKADFSKLGFSETQEESIFALKKPSDKRMLQLMSVIVSSLRPSISKFDSLQQILDLAVSTCLNVEDVDSGIACAIVTASVINKMADGIILTENLNRILGLLDEAANSERAYVLVAWVTKALVMRAHPLAETVTRKLISALPHDQFGKTAADSFRIIMSDHADLSAESHIKATFLYKQRFFAKNLPELIKLFRDYSGSIRSNVILAISHVLAGVPKQVILSEIKTVWPLLVESLARPEDGLSSSTLQLMKILISDAEEMVAEHAKSLIKALLPLCRFKNMTVRIDALECLTALAGLPSHKTFPFAHEVVKDLMDVLDDKKRLVRKKAVTCRAAWIAISG